MQIKLGLCSLEENDFDEISSAFKMIGWNKPISIYENYFQEQSDGKRAVIIAKDNGKFCGYVTVKWKSDYNSFALHNIPEISDLNVLPDYRKQGIGTALINECEAMAKKRGYTNIGLGVGMTADYGNAQRLYIQLGYIPDGCGLHYQCHSLKYNDQVVVDDDLVMFLTKAIPVNDNERRIDMPAYIETPRLVLRPPREDEGEILNTAIVESFELLHEYMLWAKEKPSLQESEAIVKKEARNWILKRKSDPEFMLFILDKKTNDFIGATGFHSIDWDVPCAETGYWIRKKYLGQGYITEAINALTQYAFNVMKVKRLAITCDVENERSKKIPERLGYRFESIMKANRVKPVSGEATDTLVYVRNDLVGLPELNVMWKKW
jgi:ribosomal-protein-serine acetyltransferase